MTDVSQYLKAKMAQWHESCRLKYSKVKVEKLINRFNESSDGADKRPLKLENKIQPTLRHSSRMAPKTCHLQFQCRFCDEFDEITNLRRATTFEVDQKVKTAANYLNDHKLIGKLSGGDMIAIDARYHLNCLGI